MPKETKNGEKGLKNNKAFNKRNKQVYKFDVQKTLKEREEQSKLQKSYLVYDNEKDDTLDNSLCELNNECSLDLSKLGNTLDGSKYNSV